MRALIAGLVVLAAGTNNAQAQTMVYGPGVSSCGQYLNDTKNNQALQYNIWLDGYVSRVSEEMNAPIPNFDIYAAEQWIINYCQANPFEQYVIAADWMIKKLRNQ